MALGSRGVFMKMNCKGFIGLLGIFLAFIFIFVACDGGNGNNNEITTPTVPDPIVSDPTVSPIEAAFTNMLKASFTFVSSSDVTINTITKMSNWGQTNSEYGVTGTRGYIKYWLPSSFGTVQVMSGGAAVITSGGAIFMSGPFASIAWGTVTGDTTDIYISGSSYNTFRIESGSDAKTVSYPYTVSYPSGSDAQIIKGKLNLNLKKW